MARYRRSKRNDLQHHDIPTKANKILNFILIALVLITARIWHLSVVQYEQRLEQSRKPQRKSVIEPATRATIRDRFNIPLAINKIYYQAAILYSEIRDIPTAKWITDDTGKRIKVSPRKEYIHKLSELLGRELNLDSERLEDLIHSKASFYAQVPYIIKEDVTEKEYYRLKMLEHDHPGIHMRKLPKRHYPMGRTASDIIGYMGSINRQEYEKILQEIKVLQTLVKESEEGGDVMMPKGIETLPQAKNRLKDLEEKAYSIHDSIGKTGIEGVYEELLRGFYGKKIFYSDSRGNHLWELPGSRPPLSGHRVLLTISAELQEFAEQILAQNESLRIVRKSGIGSVKNTVIANKHPWIKGGAIVAMDPTSGEIITLASYPRFDPNDFVSTGIAEEQKKKRQAINRWFENEHTLADIWDLKTPLEREHYDVFTRGFYDEKKWMTWQTYLDMILPKESLLRTSLNKINNIQQAVLVQQLIDNLMHYFPDESLYAIINFLYNTDEHQSFKAINLKPEQRNKFRDAYLKHHSEITIIKRFFDPYFKDLSQNYDKVLLIDLCRLSTDHERFTTALLDKVGLCTVEDYKLMTGVVVSIQSLVKESTKQMFHQHHFSEWRKKEEKAFLKTKRMEEKIAKTYPKPYLDYLDQKEQEDFNQFWEEHRWNFLLAVLDDRIPTGEDALAPYYCYFSQLYAEIQLGKFSEEYWKKSYDLLQHSLSKLSSEESIEFLKTMRPFRELTRPLYGHYRYLRQAQAPTEKSLATAFYPIYGYGYGRSHAYRQSSIQGSLFKIVTGYAGLVERYKKLNAHEISLRELNPLTIVDEVYQRGNTHYVGYTEEGKPIPQLYKGGRLPRSLAHQHNGRVDLIRALEVSSNPYFSLIAGEYLESPNKLSEAARLFSFGSKTGIQLPGEISGRVPDDLETNRTGLYAMAIGQHSLIVTPLQTAVMLSTLANGGKVLKPIIAKLTAGRQPMRVENQVPYLTSFPYQQSLSLVGIDFPLFTSVIRNQESLIRETPKEIIREIFMPDKVRLILLKGLKAAVLRSHQESLANLTKLYRQYPEAVKQFSLLKDQLLGKTSTSESVENIDLDLDEGTNMYTHVWFGTIAFQQHSEGNKNVFIFKDEFGQPELVVVVYLKYGGYGKEAAPLAALMVSKWREIKQNHQKMD